MPDEINIDTFLPKVGKNFIAPQIITIATGTTYELRRFSRPVILIAITPEDVGTVYIYPGSNPVNDDIAIPVTTGITFLDAVGDWYIRHTAASDQRFRVIDAGGAGNAQAAMSASAPAFANLNARLVPVAWGTPDLETVDGTSETLLAANSSRRALAVKNVSTGGQRITLATASPAVDRTGFLVLAQGEGYVFSPLDCVPVGAIYGIASAAGGVLSIVEGT